MDSYNVIFRIRFNVFSTTFSLCIFLAALDLQAQLNCEPSQLIGTNAVMLIDVPNLEEFILKAKSNLYDVVYGPDIKRNHILPLDLSLLKRSQAIVNRKEKIHWLLESFKAIRLSTSDEISSIVQSLEPIPKFEKRDTFTLEQENDVVGSIAGLFPGRAFFALEPQDDHLNYLFGFEYDARHFDWLAELKSTANDQAGKEAEIAVQVGAIEVYFLESDKLFFFDYNNTIYGMATGSLEDCREFAGRVLNRLDDKESLHHSRIFQRVKTSLGSQFAGNDCFCFLQLINLERALGRNADHIRPLIWGDSFGFSLKWEEADTLLSYRIVSPMVYPSKIELATVFSDALLTLDVNQARTLWPLESVCYSQLGDFQDYPDFRFSSGIAKLDPNNWFTSHTDGALEDSHGENEKDYRLGMLSAFDSLRPSRQENCDFIALSDTHNKKYKDEILGSILENKELSDWPKDEIREVFDEVAGSEQFARSKKRMGVFALARRSAIQSVRVKTAGNSPSTENSVTTGEAIVLDKENSYLLVEKDGFFFYSMGASAAWPIQLANMNTEQEFVISDWFEQGLADIDTKLLIVERTFRQPSYHCAFRPIGIAMKELLLKSENNLWWLSSSDPENKKRCSFLALVCQSIAYELQIDDYFHSFINGLGGDSKSQFIHAQILGVNKNNQLNVVYCGLFRKTKK